MKIKKVIIFDFDGTIAESMSLYADVAAKLMVKFYKKFDYKKARELYLKTSGIPFIDQLNILFPGDVEKNILVSKIFERWKENILDKIVIKREAIETFNILKKNGFTIVISSNNLQRYVEYIFKKRKVNAYIDFILGWDGKNFKKGYSHFRYIQNILGISKENMVFVGDSPNDFILADKFGIDFIAYLATFTKDSFLIKGKFPNYVRDLREVLHKIKKEESRGG